jgi:hypothetical protein
LSGALAISSFNFVQLEHTANLWKVRTSKAVGKAQFTMTCTEGEGEKKNDFYLYMWHFFPPHFEEFGAA